MPRQTAALGVSVRVKRPPFTKAPRRRAPSEGRNHGQTCVWLSLRGGPPFTLAVRRLHSSWLGSAEQAELKETQPSFSSEADPARLLGTEIQRMFSGSACRDDKLDRILDLGDAFVVAEEGGEVGGLPVRTLPVGHPASRPFLACPLGGSPSAAGGKRASCPSHLTAEPRSSWEGPLGPASFMFANTELAFCSALLGTHPLNTHSCEGQGPTIQRPPEGSRAPAVASAGDGCTPGPPGAAGTSLGLRQDWGIWLKRRRWLWYDRPRDTASCRQAPSQTGRGGGRRWGQGRATSAPNFLAACARAWLRGFAFLYGQSTHNVSFRCAAVIECLKVTVC